MVLEGVVFTAGQLALLELLDEHPELPGLRDGMERVLRDERWHLGFGGRCLQDQGLGPEDVADVLREGEAAALAWADATGGEQAARSSRCSGGASRTVARAYALGS